MQSFKPSYRQCTDTYTELMFCKYQSYPDYSLSKCQLSFSSLWTTLNASSPESVKEEKENKRRYNSLVFYLTKQLRVVVFSRKDLQEDRVHTE